MSEKDIWTKIERAKNDVQTVALAYYQWKYIHNIGSTLNAQQKLTFTRHSAFWSATLYSLQNTYILGLSKLFDKSKGTYNLYKVIDTCKKNKIHFSNAALEARRVSEGHDPAIAKSYADASHEPSDSDFDNLRKTLARSEEIVTTKLHPIRNNVIAHAASSISLTDTHSLYNDTDIDELETVIDWTNTVTIALWGAWVNGHEFSLEINKYIPPGPLFSETQELITRAS